MTEQVLNTELLNDYLDNLGHAVLEKMYALYCRQSAEYIEQIADSIEQESQSLWQERCHKMKGAAASAGLVATHKHLVAIEKAANSRSDKLQQLQQLKQLNTEGTNAFNKWLTQ